MASVLEAAKQTITQNLGVDANKYVDPSQQFSFDDIPSQEGKVAVVTGGTEGVGFAVSYGLIEKGIKKIYLIALSQEIADGAIKAFKDEIGPEVESKIEFLPCDLSEWDGIPKIADKIINSTDRLDVLVLDAGRGIMTAQKNSYGVDLHMATNVFGPITLTSHLLPLLKKTSEQSTVRIVSVASRNHMDAPSDIKFESLDELNKDYGPNGQYGRSKLADILHMKYLNKHVTEAGHPNLLANASHPGIVKTRQSEEFIHEPYPILGFAMSVGLAPFKKDQFQGALSTLFAATKLEKSGCYICPPAVEEKGSAQANDEQLGENLMKLARDIIKNKTYSESAAKGCPFVDA